MTASIPVFNADQDPALIAQALDEAGCVVLRDAADPALLDKVRADLADAMAVTRLATEDSPEEFYHRQLARVPCPATCLRERTANQCR